MRPETREEYASKVPALKTLINLGWEYLPPAEVMKKRQSRRHVVLKDELVKTLSQRTFEHRGKTHPLSNNTIEKLVSDLSSTQLNEGLMTANRATYNKLTLGITETEFVEGKSLSVTVPIIDWNNISNNRFHITEEFQVETTSGTTHCTPDIVCFLNGIPLVVIEAKRPESGNPNKDMLKEGISQTLRNQKVDEIPHLFAFAQLLLSINANDGRYGTTATPQKFWSQWREEQISEDELNSIKNRQLTAEVHEALFASRPAEVRQHFETLWAGGDLLPTDQDRLLVGLLTPSRLLEFLRYYLLFDSRIGKIAARFPQFFGTRALLDRVQQKQPAGGRPGGVIWHTTGSGKSYSMVYLCNALLLHDALKNCRVIVVTDRIDLEKQLFDVFRSSGAFGYSEISTKKAERMRAQTGRDLAKRIGKGNERIIFTLINKFTTATKLPECHNDSKDLIVLIDEGHRSHGGENHERMRKALPNAALVAFTGTPLLKKDKTTNKFGPILHAYTMQRAVDDGTVTPLLYEERQPDLDVNDKAIDVWFERITASLSHDQQTDLKKKYARRKQVYGSSHRIELIAWDIATHFSVNFKSLDLGLKGQVATDSKISAIRYKQQLDSTGLVSSAVVISPPDTREGHKDTDESKTPEVQAWWKENVGQKPARYEDEIIKRFSEPGDPDLLIVVDKLLTGFDEPRNTVLYIDKPLREHNLMQAIARVNRLHEDKPFGYLIDYRGTLEELDSTIEKFQNLAERTQSGYDIDDIDGLVQRMSSEYKKLPRLHRALWSVFSAVSNRGDLEQYRQVLMPKHSDDQEGHAVDDQLKVREDFYQALTEFGLCLKTALSSRAFFADSGVSERQIETYKRDLKWFTELRQIARRDAQETVDYSGYEEQVRRLVDQHVIGVGVREPDAVYQVDKLGQSDPDTWSDDKARNEADLIRTRLRKTIEQDLADNPYAQKVFSELLREAIAEAEALFDHPLKQYAIFERLAQKVREGEINTVPATLADHGRAASYYGVLRIVKGDEFFAAMRDDEHEKYIEIAIDTDAIVTEAIAEQSLDVTGMEAAIRKGLLPPLFNLLGMEDAKKTIERIVQMVRFARVKDAVA